MGDPKKQRKKYDTPRFRWRKDILQEELKLLGQYGLRNKHELWRHKTMLSKTRGIARSLIGNTPEKPRHTKRNSGIRQRFRLVNRGHAGTQAPNARFPKGLSENNFPIPPAHNAWTRNHRKPTRYSAQLHCVKRGRRKSLVLTSKHAYKRDPSTAPSPVTRG